MSRIDELITKLCPDGVPYKLIGDVASVGTGSSDRKDANEDGQYPFYVRSKDVMRKDSYEFDEEAILIPGEGGIGDIFHYVSGKYALHQRAYRISFRTPDVDTKFAYYYFISNFKKFILSKAVSATVTSIRKPMITQFSIPVPPVEVQREIVRVLDLFQSLGAELEAELEARMRQYAFCWRALLTPGKGWRSTTLGEIASVFDGPHATPKKTDSGPWYLSISSLTNGRFDLAESAHIGADQYDIWIRRVAPRVGDTMFSYETRLGQAAYWDRDEPAALGRRMGLLRPRESEVYPRFLTLAYLGPEFQSLIRAKTVSGATVDRIPIADMPSWPISIPSISEQQRIVGILDKFDALVNDRSIGLPAEIDARRKQFRYYRDRLLSFKELTA